MRLLARSTVTLSTKLTGAFCCSAVTKPVVGIFDLANNVTEGIRNTTTVFDQSGIDRVRLPRFTASDGVIRVGSAPSFPSRLHLLD